MESKVFVDADLWHSNLLQYGNTIGFREMYMQLYNATIVTSEPASMADFLDAWLQIKKPEAIVANAIIDTCVTFAVYNKLKDVLNEAQKDDLLQKMELSWSIFTETPIDPNSILDVPFI